MYKDLVARGLRARLESQSIITGTLFVNLGLYPDTPLVLSEPEPAGEYPEIPTIPTQIAEVGKSVTALLTHLESVDFAGTVQSFQSAVASVDRVVSNGHLPRALKEVSATMASYRQLADNVDTALQPLLAELQAATGERTEDAGGSGRRRRGSGTSGWRPGSAPGAAARGARRREQGSQRGPGAGGIPAAQPQRAAGGKVAVRTWPRAPGHCC